MKAWRDAASLILAARHNQKLNRTSSPSVFQYNYNILCLKRHQKTKFMPGSYVFPGGVVHPADAQLQWKELFKNFGFDSSSFSELFPNTTVRPRIFRSKGKELPREISLRITAIRETFEECGILMCRRSQDETSQSGWAQPFTVSEDELERWQTKVHNDATQFYKLCEALKCYPDIWSLYEWSNWLTPTSLTTSRFDTIFYLACIPHVPYTMYEMTEMEDMKWDTPKNFLDAPSNLRLPPPQHYEIARIAKFECLDNLLDFAVERSNFGIHQIMPVKVKLSDGMVHVLPGDSMYPKEASLTEVQIIDRTDITMEEFRNLSPIKNRMEFVSLEVNKIEVQNYESTEGHLSPMPIETINVQMLKKK